MSAPSPALVAALEAVGTLAEAEGYRSASWGRHGDLQLSWAAKVDDGRCYGWRRCPITGRPTCNVELIHSVEGVRVEVTAGPSAALISRRLRHPRRQELSELADAMLSAGGGGVQAAIDAAGDAS